jgi:hypothetical protein
MAAEMANTVLSQLVWNFSGFQDKALPPLSCKKDLAGETQSISISI